MPMKKHLNNSKQVLITLSAMFESESVLCVCVFSGHHPGG